MIPKKIIAIPLIIMIAAISVVVLTSMYQTVPTGYEGVVLSYGNPVRTVGSGLTAITPFAEDIELVNVQIQSATAQESAASSDLQEVTTSVTVNYQLDSAYAKEIYVNLRDQYESRVIIPAMQDALKASTAKFQASQLITDRETAKSTFQTLLQTKLNAYHINIISVAITDFQFSTNFRTAIDAKVTAEQNALAAQNQLAVVQAQAQQQVINATAVANAQIALAQGSANATMIQANATASAMQIINTQLTPEYIAYLNIQQFYNTWNGQYPNWYFATGTNNTSGLPYMLISPTTGGNTTQP